jgi:phosphoribosylaminoimidazole-succinocarboxamide synthase
MKELYKGKVKTVLQTENPDEVLIRFEDKVTCGNGKHETHIPGKGAINCEISAILFEKLHRMGIKNHYLNRPEPNIMCCERVEIIPLEVVVRNVATGSIVRETTIQEGTRFCPELIEFYLKDDSNNDPLLTPDRMNLMGYDVVDIRLFKGMAYEINVMLKEIFNSIDIDLIDFKLEFGYTSRGEIILADEISPDGCRLWRKGTTESMDKDLYRKNTGNIMEAYQQILAQLK